MESLSIGAVVRLTGISADTLRTWERRYGFPTPERNESGHRRYARAEFERLVLVKGMVARGHRPSEVISMPEEALRAAAGEVAPANPRVVQLHEGQELWQRAHEICLGVLLKAEKLDGAGIDKLLDTGWQQLGPHATLEHVVLPLLVQIGERWQAGRLGIHHEHLFSGRVTSFLCRQWQPRSDAAAGPTIVLATPPGEEHELGLHVAATFLAMDGARIVFLGQNTPAHAIVEAYHRTGADAVALSVSVRYHREMTASVVNEILLSLPPQRLLLGGAGAVGGSWPCAQATGVHEVRAWLACLGGESGWQSPVQPAGRFEQIERAPMLPQSF